MKPVLWTKLFHFSASFSKGAEVRGHNFTLAVTAEYADGMDEAAVEEKIEKALIRKVHSRDLSLHVDFLRGVDITDHNLLKAFLGIISREIAPIRLHSLALERDARTRLLLHAEPAP